MRILFNIFNDINIIVDIPTLNVIIPVTQCSILKGSMFKPDINKYTPVIDILIRIKYIITIVKIIMKSLIYTNLIKQSI